MQRADVLSYLQGTLNSLATEATQPRLSDTPDGYGPALSAAFRAVGVAEADLFTSECATDKGADILALARYYALEGIVTRLATAVDLAFDAPAMSKKRSQLFTQVSKLLDRALADITSRGYGPQDFILGKIQLDIFEPQQGYPATPWGTW